jgi:hypothetical protein
VSVSWQTAARVGTSPASSSAQCTPVRRSTGLSALRSPAGWSTPSSSHSWASPGASRNRGPSLSPSSESSTETAREWDRAEQQAAASVAALGSPPRGPGSEGTATSLSPQSGTSPPVRPNRSPPSGGRHQSWFGTWIPGPTDQEARRRFDALPECRVLVVGKETCPSTGTLHLQFCFQLKRTTWSFQQACRALPNAWIRPLQKPIEAAIRYCRGTTKAKAKLGEPNVLLYNKVEILRPGPKKTKEVASAAAWEACVRGDPRPLLKELDPQRQVQHCKRIKEATLTLPLLKGLCSERQPPYFIWLFGASGAGKTSFAKSFVRRWAPNSTFTVSPPREGARGVWMDGYLPAVHKVVLLDDARPHWLGASELLTLCNSTSRTVEWKGASTPFDSSVMLLTTTEPPWEFFSQSPTEAPQVARRVNLLVEIGPSSEGLTARRTGNMSGAISSSFHLVRSPSQGNAAGATTTGSSATSAVRTVRWNELMPSSSVESWLGAMNAPRAQPCMEGRVLACRASPEGGEEHRVWEERALMVSDVLGLERAYLRYRE